MNDNLKKALLLMEFETLPSMGELRKKFRKMCLEKHPDKFPEEEKIKKTKEFQELNNACKMIGEAIKEEMKEKEANEEEEDELKWFEMFNFDQKNKQSHTVFIQNEAVSEWKTILSKKFGPEVDRGSNGIQYKATNVEIEGVCATVFLTLYDTPKSDSKSKVLVQSRNQLFNDEFALKEMPEIFKEVRKLNIAKAKIFGEKYPEKDAEKVKPASKARKPKPSQRQAPYEAQKRNVNPCDECELMFSSLQSLNKHKRKEHSESDNNEEKINDETFQNNQRNRKPCTECDETFDTWNDRNNHITLHSKVYKELTSHNPDSCQTPSSSATAVPCNVTPTEGEAAGPAPNTRYCSSTDTTVTNLIQYSQCDKTDESDESIEEAERDEDEETVLSSLRKELDKAIEKINSLEAELRKAKASKKTLEIENKTVKAELQKGFVDVKDKNEENTKLKEEKSRLQKIIDTHPKILKQTEDKARENAFAEREKEGEIEEIEVLNQQKNAGYRRESPAAEAKKKDERNKCLVCNFEATTKSVVKEHMNAAHPDKCDDCAVTVGTAGHLRRHIRLVHKKELPVINCDKCSYKCNSKAQLINHKQLNHYEHKEDLEIPENCRFWIKNSCKFGINCKNDHPTIEEIAESKQIRRCRFQQNCRAWPNCSFYHEEEERREYCRYQERCSRPDCRYLHQTSQRGEYSTFTVQCRYGENCTWGDSCKFDHSFLVNRPMQSTRLKPLPMGQVMRQGRQLRPTPMPRQLAQQEIIRMWRPWDL